MRISSIAQVPIDKITLDAMTPICASHVQTRVTSSVSDSRAHCFFLHLHFVIKESISISAVRIWCGWLNRGSSRYKVIIIAPWSALCENLRSPCDTKALWRDSLKMVSKTACRERTLASRYSLTCRVDCAFEIQIKFSFNFSYHNACSFDLFFFYKYIFRISDFNRLFVSLKKSSLPISLFLSRSCSLSLKRNLL